IKGDVSFPTVKNLTIKKNKFSTKAISDNFAIKTSISVIYPANHPTKANQTISSGITDESNRFSFSPENTFSPNVGDIFILEARKRVSAKNSNILTMRTYIKWNGTEWESLTKGIVNINAKTTALSMIYSDNPTMNLTDLFGQIDMSTNEGSFLATSVSVKALSLSVLVRSVLEQATDPLVSIKKQVDGTYISESRVELNGLVQKNKCQYCKITQKDVATFSFANKDLSYSDFSGLDLTSKDLSNSILYKANLSGSKLNLANLTGVDFSGANLTGAIIDNPIISDTSFVNGDFTNASFISTDVSYSNFSNAIFKNTLLNNLVVTGSDFTNASFVLSRLNFDTVNLKDSILNYADFSGLDFNNKDFTTFTFKGTIFKDTILNNSNFSNLILENVDFTNANLEFSNFSTSKIINGIFTNARLLNSNFYKSILNNAIFENAILTGATLFNSDLTDVNFTNTNLESANLNTTNLNNSNFNQTKLNSNTLFGGANLETADLSGLNFSGSNFKGALFKSNNLNGYNLSNANFSKANFNGGNLSNANITGANFDMATFINTIWVDNTIPNPIPGYDSISESSDFFAYSTNKDGNNEIYMMNENGLNQLRLTSNTVYDYNPIISPNKKKIMYVGEDSNGDEEIFIVNVDGTNLINLTNNANNDDYSPVFSDDGTKIIYTSEINGWSDIFIMNIDGSNKINLTNLENTKDKNPTIFKNKIVFYSGRNGNDDIYSMNFDGSYLTQLTTNTASDKSPKFSPDGTKILFLSDVDHVGLYNIWTMDANTGDNKKRITNHWVISSSPYYTAMGESEAFWSNDSKYIFYTSFIPEKGINSIFYINTFSQFPNPNIIIPYESLNKNYFSKGYLNDNYEIFTGNSSKGKIMYSSDKTGNYNFYSMDLNYKLTKQLTNY
ncbi:MAG: pentapeptide repeat-containing protein, partial [Cyanobacteriota bacterium]